MSFHILSKKLKQGFAVFLLLSFLQQSVFGCGFLLPAFAETTEAAQATTAEEAASEDTMTAEAAEADTEESTESAGLVWPQLEAGIQAESAVVMDADSQEVLWGRDIHAKRYPASVTKLLTALVVLDHCSLDETVTFSQSAVSNLESGAVTIGTVAGDTLSVEDCLYALLLKSANEVANALAEHVSGSVEEFAVLMNEKARELGCQDSDFRNPSGLTDAEHVTSAYDMALIACACMDSPEFMALESENSRKIGGTTNYPDGLTVTIGHKMKKEGETYYDSRVTAGKTGFTSASGNTLVTMAEAEGRRLAVVVLKDTTPAHYTDTRALLDYGFSEFQNLLPTLSVLNEALGLEDALVEEGYLKPANEETGEKNELSFDTQPVVTVPKNGGLKDLVLELQKPDPGDEETSGAGASEEGENGSDAQESTLEESEISMVLSCLGHEAKPVQITAFHLTPVTSPQIAITQEEETSPEDESSPDSDEGGNLLIRGLFLLAFLAAGVGIYRMLQKKRAEERRKSRRELRQKRLQLTRHMTDEEYEAYMEKERQEREKTYGRPPRRKSRFDVHSKEEEELLKNLSGASESQTGGQSEKSGKDQAEKLHERPKGKTEKNTES